MFKPRFELVSKGDTMANHARNPRIDPVKTIYKDRKKPTHRHADMQPNYLPLIAGGVILVVLIIVIAISVTNCSGQTTTDQDPTQNQNQSQEQEQTAAPTFDGSAYSDMGEGVFIISTPEGTTEGDNYPMFAVEADTAAMQISYMATGFKENSSLHVYLDGHLVTSSDTNNPQGTITLQGDTLAPGRHVVEAVQFADNDPLGEVVVYKSGVFEITA